MRPYRRELQAVFQDPYSSLNPRMRAADIVAEPIRNFETVSAAGIRERVASLFDQVGLRADQMVEVSVRILRRPAPAPRHRARACATAEADRLRRAGVGARRVGAGAGHQPADGSAGRIRPLVPVRRARSRGGRAHQPSRRGHVPGQDRRARTDKRSLFADAAASVHGGAALGRPGARPERAEKAHHSRGRRAESRQSASRLPLSHALSVRVRPLPRRGARLVEVRPGHFAACHLREPVSVATHSNTESREEPTP